MMKTWSKDLAMRIELTGRIGEAFQRMKRKIWVTYYIRVINDLSSGDIDDMEY